MGGIGLIPWSKIVKYVEDAGLDGDVAEASAAILHELDKGYVASVNKK